MMRRTDTTIIISRIPVRELSGSVPCSSWPVFCSTTRCQFSSEYTGPRCSSFPFRFLLCPPKFPGFVSFPSSQVSAPDIMAAVKFKPVCLHMPIAGSGDLYGSVFPQQSCCDIEFIFIRPEQLFQVIYPDSDTDNPEDGAVPPPSLYSSQRR